MLPTKGGANAITNQATHGRRYIVVRALISCPCSIGAAIGCACLAHSILSMSCILTTSTDFSDLFLQLATSESLEIEFTYAQCILNPRLLQLQAHEVLCQQNRSIRSKNSLSRGISQGRLQLCQLLVPNCLNESDSQSSSAAVF